MEIILGSTSARRKEILQFFSLPFRVVPSDFDETQVPFHGDPKAFAMEVSHRKALSLVEKFPNDLIITADTIVYYNGRLFLKPESLEEAHGMLLELSGKEHQVFTGVTLIGKNGSFIEVEESRVHLNHLTKDQVVKYHTKVYPLDKSGAYTIQNLGSIIVKRVEGCYYNVMGLPIQTVERLLHNVGIDLWEYL